MISLILLHSTHTQEKLLVYSLRTHQIVKSLIIPGLLSFSSNDRFIVVVRFIFLFRFLLLFTDLLPVYY